MKSIVFAASAAMVQLSLPAALFVAPAQAQEQKVLSFSVNAQPLTSALEEFSRQADMTITAPGRLTEGKQSPGFRGVATPAEAIAVLLKGTGLQAREQGGALIIQQEAEESALLGTLRGQVLRADNQVPLRQVQVSVPGTAFSTTTDRFGRFELNLPAGEYVLRLEHSDYGSQTVPNLEVRANLALDMELMLQPAVAAAGVVEEVVVTDTRYSERSVDRERDAAGVVDTIDFEQIARFDDSTVSSALSRIVGVSLEEGRYAVVRGMKSRYQSVYFNDAILPSTDPGRRDLAMDIFPASIMQELSLQKTASPDVPGTATAGHIDMGTKEVPDEAFLKISAAIDFWDDVDDDVLRVEGGDTDWLGYDDGARDIPRALDEISGSYYDNGGRQYDVLSPEQKEAAGESIDHRDINIGESNQSGSLDISAGGRWQIGEQAFGVIGALRYSNRWTNRDLLNYRFSKKYDSESRQFIGIELTEYYSTWDSNNIIDLSGMLNFIWEPTDGQTIGWNNILLRHTLNSVEKEYFCDRCFDANGAYEYHPADDFAYTYDIDWIEEQLWGTQLWGSHRFDSIGGLRLDWLWLDASSQFDRPDAKRYRWAGNDQSQSPQLWGDSSSNRFEWEEMEEDNSSYRLDLTLPLFADAPVSAALSAGGYLLERERNGSEYGWYYVWERYSTTEGVLTQREVESQQPGDFFTDENICGHPEASSCDGAALQVWGIRPDQDVGLTGRNYLVQQEIDAYYLKADFDFWGKLKATLGARREDFSIGADMYEYSPEPLIDLLEEDYTLYSATLTYLFSEQWQLRLGYSDTVSWPEVFEVVPRTFTDYDTREQFVGNPNLRPAEIKNYDIRLEWYPDTDESITLAYFVKDLSDAIENTFLGESEQYSYYTFDNVRSASVSGWELDARQVYSLGGGHDLFVQLNYADIRSEVELPEDTLEYDRNRPLQGQPDYLLNLQIGYDHVPTDQQVTLVFSRRGEELAVVTAEESFVAIGNNVYEQPYDDLKLIYKKGFVSGWTALLSLENALGSKRNLEYDAYGAPYLSYDIGTRAKLKLTYTF